MAKDPAAIAKKWADRASAATQDYIDGVNAVQIAPGRAAAAASDLWAANTAASKPKYARNVAAVSAEEWKAAAVGKGAPRIATGVQAAQQKMATFMQRHLQIVDTVRNSLPPRGNTEQNIARSVAMQRGVSQAYKGQ